MGTVFLHKVIFIVTYQTNNFQKIGGAAYASSKTYLRQR